MATSSQKRELRQVPLVDLAAQIAPIRSEIEQAILQSIDDGDYILGRAVEQFEEEFAAFCGVDYAVGVDSGMSALELTLLAFDIGPGHEVITPANSFVATALAISHVGARPILVDVDARTHNLDLIRIRKAITHRTRAIMPVHLYGQPADMDAINAIADERGLIVIEDACQAHGARYNGRRTGSLGHAAAFSFYPSKNLGALGDGGIVVTSNKRAAERIRMLRNYGQREKYCHVALGFNHRLDTLQAAALRVKLRRLDSDNESRRATAEQYQNALADTPLGLPWVADFAEPVWHLYVVRSSYRDALASYLKHRGIATCIHYPVPIHLQPAYRDLGHRRGDFPITEQAAREILSLPMYAGMQREQVEYVATCVREFVEAQESKELAA